MGEAQQKAALREALKDAQELEFGCVLTLADIAALASAGEAILNMAQRQGRGGTDTARALATAVEKMNMCLRSIELISSPAGGTA